ncbi:MAG: hypothetical protein KDC75_06515 [Phaeodactylibacter sp.]|nr:hypothetical protein [Phaeodactylibacter sp.]
MKSACFFLLLFFFLATGINAQDEIMKDANAETDLPYYQIPPYPETYTAGTVAARLIDGLGFRYFWATEGLRPEDLQFRPNEAARTTEETLDHIYELSILIVNAPQHEPNQRTQENTAFTFEQKRRQTLANFKTASDLLKASEDKDMAGHNLIFQRGNETSEYPFWNLINGPIADALWHVGQVVSFRRSSGNPFNPKVSVFSGKVRD